MKGSVALLAGALPAIVSYSHDLPPAALEISSAGSTPAGPASAGLASAVAFVVRPNAFPAPSLGVSGRSSSRSNAPRPTHSRVLAFVPARQCAATHKRPAVGAVSFGSSSVAGVEGAFEAAAAAGLDRDPRARGVGVNGGVGAPAEAAAAEGGDDEALDAFSSAVASCAAAVVDEGELVCQKLEGVVSREAEVVEQEVLLRVAHLDDYFAIADVRFDVFSPVHSTLKHRFRERSCLLMRERRRRGAFCLVAALGESARAAAAAAAAADTGAAASVSGREGDQPGGEGGGDGDDVDVDVGVDVVEAVEEVSHDHVLGTLECSRHEFDGTPLEVQVEEGGAKIARLYLTEVAVRSDCRRKGVGRVLLGLVDDVAKELKTSEVFLHVNEVNEAALRLYASCGYDEAPDCASNRAFTNSLGLSGGFIGQRHRLLHKTFPSADASGGSGKR